MIRFWILSDPGSPDPILGVPIRFWESRSDLSHGPIRFWESRSDLSHGPIRFWESRSDSGSPDPILGVPIRSDSGTHDPILDPIRSDPGSPDTILGVCMQGSRSDLSHGPIRFWESRSDPILGVTVRFC